MARLTSSRVISRLRPATATTPRLLNALTCAPDSARYTLSISMPAVSSASSIARLIASAAESTLLTTPRRMPLDSARPMPMMSRLPASMISPTTADTFDVPTSSPTRYLSLRAMRYPRRLLPIQLVAVSQIHVVVDRELRSNARRRLHPSLQPLQKILVSEVERRRLVAQRHDGVARVRHVD